MATYNLFISHAWKYNEEYYKIVEWLNEAQTQGSLNWKNYSVPEHDPLINPNTPIGKNRLRELIKGQISPSSKVIIVAGMYAAYSDWIDYEIDTSIGYSKYIIGIRPWTQERVPLKISNNANIMVGWNKSSLISAIKNS